MVCNRCFVVRSNAFLHLFGKVFDNFDTFVEVFVEVIFGESKDSFDFDTESGAWL